MKTYQNNPLKLDEYNQRTSIKTYLRICVEYRDVHEDEKTDELTLNLNKKIIQFCNNYPSNKCVFLINSCLRLPL